VEATLVRNGRVHSEGRELFVPPERGLLNMTVKTDKEVYRPGDKGKVRVEVTDSNGKPASGDVTLTAYDEAVTYIQDEFGPSPWVFFYGQKPFHHVEVDSSLEQTFSPSGLLRYPQSEIYIGNPPEGWNGFWQLEGFGLTLSGANTYTGATTISGNAIDALDFSRAERGAVSKALAAPMAATAAPAGAPMEAAFAGGFAGKDVADKSEMKPDSSGTALVEPEIRANFSDTALWMPRLTLDKNGVAETEITFPQSLTTWRLHGYTITRQTKVGDALTKVTTTKNLIVRLQAPRFFIERDEVVLSANVNNYLKSEQPVKAELIIPAAQFQPLDGASSGESAQAWPGQDHRQGPHGGGERWHAPGLSRPRAWHQQAGGAERLLSCDAGRRAHAQAGPARGNRSRAVAAGSHALAEPRRRDGRRLALSRRLSVWMRGADDEPLLSHRARRRHAQEAGHGPGDDRQEAQADECR
jgi:autotransporter-associated beta strand protein